MPHRGEPPTTTSPDHLLRPARLLLALQAFAHNTPLQSNILSFLSRKPSLIHPSSTRVPRRASLTVGLFFFLPGRDPHTQVLTWCVGFQAACLHFTGNCGPSWESRGFPSALAVSPHIRGLDWISPDTP